MKSLRIRDILRSWLLCMIVCRGMNLQAQDLGEQVISARQGGSISQVVPLSGNRVAMETAFDRKGMIVVWNPSDLKFRALKLGSVAVDLAVLRGNLVEVKLGRESFKLGVPIDSSWIDPATGESLHQHKQVFSRNQSEADFESVHCVSPTARYLLISDVSDVFIIDRKTKKKTKVERGEERFALTDRTKTGFSRNEKYFYFLDEQMDDLRFMVHKLPNMEAVRSLVTGYGPVSRPIEMNDSLSHATVVGTDAMQVLELPSLKETARMDLKLSWNDSRLLSQDGSALICKLATQLRCYTLADKSLLWRHATSKETQLKCFLSDGEHFAYGRKGQALLRVLDAGTGRGVFTLLGASSQSWIIVIPDGHYCGEFEEGDFLVEKGGARTPIEKHPSYKRSVPRVKEAISEAFKRKKR